MSLFCLKFFYFNLHFDFLAAQLIFFKAKINKITHFVKNKKTPPRVHEVGEGDVEGEGGGGASLGLDIFKLIFGEIIWGKLCLKIKILLIEHVENL